jgi:hypothetical protein
MLRAADWCNSRFLRAGFEDPHEQRRDKAVHAFSLTTTTHRRNAETR